MKMQIFAQFQQDSGKLILLGWKKLCIKNCVYYSVYDYMLE